MITHIGGYRVKGGVELPSLNASSAIQGFQEAAAAQEASYRTGLEYYTTSLQEASTQMQAGYASANKTLNPLSESSNTALDETMRMMGLDPVQREGVEYKAGYTPEERNEKLENLPGYQFQVEQGTKAIERQGAAKSMLGSGNTLMALQEYGQEMGKNYFQGYLDNLNRITESGKGATFAIAQNQTELGGKLADVSMAQGKAEYQTEKGIGDLQAQSKSNQIAAQRAVDQYNADKSNANYQATQNRLNDMQRSQLTANTSANRLDWDKTKFSFGVNDSQNKYAGYLGNTNAGSSGSTVTGWNPNTASYF